MNRFFTLLLAASCLTAVGQCPEIGQHENSCGQCYFPEGESGIFTATYTGEIGVWTVPPGVTEISITLSGAQGGQNIHGGCSNYFGGLGATLSADFEVSAGTELFYIVGEQGHEYNNQQSVHPSANGGGGGGGGSFVWTLSNGIKNLLIAAGGGGGSSACTLSNSGGIIPDEQYYGIGGTGELSGTADVLGTISGGVNGSDGSSIHPEVYSGEGLGWNSISVNPLSIPEFNGATFGYSSNEAAGAFGGGGTSSGDHNGGGGGGYSGGGARPYNGYMIYDENGNTIQYIPGFPGELCGGGGGGSFNSGINQEFLGTLQTGNGILQIEYDGALPICGGCTDLEACNFDLGATIDNGTCEFIPEGDCDCNGNQLDALWVCGGFCGFDVDADGICDDIDDCVGVYDACGVCNGPGEIYDCGCEDIIEGDCDCNGNQLDALWVCGGLCGFDVDADGICDDIDDCVGIYDACGICNGPGSIYECGCVDIPEGDCDCEGNQFDALGVCGGNCVEDADADGICDENSLCGTASLSTLTVEITEDVLGDLDLYRLYIDLPPIPNWYVSAVAGDQNISPLNPLRVTTLFSAPEGVFNTPLNASWNASGLSTAFIGVFPEMAFDSYVTIGLAGPASESIFVNAADPNFSGNSQTASDFLNFFNNSGETDLEVEDGVWYVTPTNANQGMGDENGRCLIGQLCSSGSIQGQLIVQILESDLVGSTITDGGEMVRYAFNGSGTFEGVAENTYYPFGGGIEALTNIPICGCGDPEASNFIPWVEVATDTCEYSCLEDVDDDGICDDVDECVGAFDECGVCNGAGANLECGCEGIPDGACDCDGNQLDVLGVCGGSCNSDVNGNGVCDDNEALGCTYPLADNFNEGATLDDGTCIFPCEGQVNVNVFDWDGDYAVTVTDFLMMLSVYGDVDVDLDGVWDSGDDCVDTNACNYANDPSEPCAFIDVLGICGGECAADEDEDGVCDDVDDCVGIIDECGVCNGPGPTEVVIESITILYDSVYAEQIDQWFVFEVGADTTFAITCGSAFLDCGDPVNYQGYDYATVLIGEQCWFSENLRYLPSVGIPSENPGVPNVTVCDYDGNNIDEAMNQWNYQTYGALYNFPAVTNWQLCPSGYHVPSDDDWKVLESYLGMPADEIESTADSRGNSVGAHLSLKADSPLWGNQGNNSTQFSGLPSGTSFSSNDLCALIASEPNDGGWAIFGSSTLAEAEGVWVRLLTDNITDGIPRFGVDTYQLNGTDIYFSVRCVKDE